MHGFCHGGAKVADFPNLSKFFQIIDFQGLRQ
jgi:hypothetical protein